MSVSSVNSSNPYSYLQWPNQADSVDDASGPPSDPLQALYQAISGGNNSSDSLLAAASQDGSGGLGAPQFSPDVMKALLAIQGDQANSGNSRLQALFGKFDTDSDGQISQSEFEAAVGSNADKAKVDALFNKIDANGDGAVSQDEMQSAMQKAQDGHHHHRATASGSSQQSSDPLQALLSSASADGTTSQAAANADGSTTTTITYADGTKVTMTTPAASNATASDAASSNPEAPNFANLLKQLSVCRLNWLHRLRI